MKGRVIRINPKIDFVAVDTEGSITFFELLGEYEIEIDDIISGDLEAHAGKTLLNISKHEKMDVYIQGVQCTPQFARKLLD